MKLTKKRAIELHRELWDWLYHHPSKEKTNWPGWSGIISHVSSSCFLCEYTEQRGMHCWVGCPLQWPDKYCETWAGGGLFGHWDHTKTPRIRKKYAKLIRDLPEKK